MIDPELEVRLNRLREYVHYDPETGVVSCIKRRPGGKWEVGVEIGNADRYGYLPFQSEGRQYLLHRVIHFLMPGIVRTTLGSISVRQIRLKVRPTVVRARTSVTRRASRRSGTAPGSKLASLCGALALRWGSSTRLRKPTLHTASRPQSFTANSRGQHDRGQQ